MSASPWVSELFAAESASLTLAKRSGRLLGFAAVAACIAMVFTMVHVISMNPRGATINIPVAIITAVLFLIFAIWGALLHRRVSTLRKHTLALYDQHGPLTTDNTTLAQLQPHLAGWTVARDTPRSLHLLHRRTTAQARAMKFVQFFAGVFFIAIFAVTIWHYGWALTGLGTGISALKLKLLVYALAPLGVLLPLAATVPSPVQLLIDRDTSDEILLESVSLRGVRAQMLPLAEVDVFVVNSLITMALLTDRSRMLLLEFSPFEIAKTPKALRPLYENITTVRTQLLHDALTRVTGKSVDIK
ncbi:MAG: hypothetical protein ACK5ZG_08185 [Phycisphaerae bacterium]|jgi:hypothetical protein